MFLTQVPGSVPETDFLKFLSPQKLIKKFSWEKIQDSFLALSPETAEFQSASVVRLEKLIFESFEKKILSVYSRIGTVRKMWTQGF